MYPDVLLETYFQYGKLNERSRTETIDVGPVSSKRRHIRDLSTGLIYFVDTSSDISLLPVDSKTVRKKPSDIVVFVTNDSRVPTFGEISVTLNLNLRRIFKWNCCVTQVPYPIIGADMLAHFHLVPYFHES